VQLGFQAQSEASSAAPRSVTYMQEVKIYGERNAGTNYVEGILLANLPVVCLPGTATKAISKAQRLLPGREWLRDAYFEKTFAVNLGWKHSLVDAGQLLDAGARGRGIRFITITKNPYSWLLSMHRRPYHHWADRTKSFEEFLQSNWQPLRRECMTASHSPVELWNIKNRAYLQLEKVLPVLRLRYEDLLDNPEKVIARAAQFLEVRPLDSSLTNIEAATKKRDRGKGFSFYKTYYLEEQWREFLSEDLARFISARLDAEVVKAFGYELIQSAPHCLPSSGYSV
jgi:Sulfotransferase domain